MKKRLNVIIILIFFCIIIIFVYFLLRDEIGANYVKPRVQAYPAEKSPEDMANDFLQYYFTVKLSPNDSLEMAAKIHENDWYAKFTEEARREVVSQRLETLIYRYSLENHVDSELKELVLSEEAGTEDGFTFQAQIVNADGTAVTQEYTVTGYIRFLKEGSEWKIRAFDLR